MKIVFAWELGANLAYMSRQIPVAERLREEGHDVAFVVRDLQIAGPLLSARHFRFVPAPVLLKPFHLSRKPINYSEVLLEQGYGQVATLQTLLGWVHLWRLLDPDVVVADHAPTASLSARVLSIPRVVWSSPFQTPPHTEPWPSIRPWEPITNEALCSADENTLRNINQVLGQLGHPTIGRMADIYADAPVLIATFPELDHYGERSDVEYVGPMLAGLQHRPIDWPRTKPRRILAYLRSTNPGLEPLLSAMRQSEAEVICSIPDARPSLRRRLVKQHFLVFDEPISLNTLIADADLMVSYGGAGTLAQALLNGVPLLMAPQVVEQVLGARRVAKLGAGLLLDGARQQTVYSHAISDLLTNLQYRTSAREFSIRHQNFRREHVIHKVTSAIAHVTAAQGSVS